MVLTHVAYDFLGLLPSRESLATRGRRLHDTPQQRQNKVYAPDILLKVDVEDALQRLQANFVDGRHIVLAEGETKRMTIRLLNSGKNPISELWVLGGSEDELWVDDQSPSTSGTVSLFHSFRAVLIYPKHTISHLWKKSLNQTTLCHLEKPTEYRWRTCIPHQR